MSEVAVMPLEDYKNACDSVRAKTGKTELITSEQLSAEIDSIEKGYDPSDATASIFDVVMGKTFYNAQGKQTGAIPIQSGKQITPSTRNQYVGGARYLGGDIVVLGEPNLLPENIPEDMTFFGVQGTRKMSGGDDAYLKDFCDGFQLKGTRTNYSGAFDCLSGQFWTPKNWKFMYSIRPTVANGMFRGMKWTETGGAVDFVDFLATLNIELDFSNATNVQGCFRDCSSFTHLGVIDASSTANVTQLFYLSSGTDRPLVKIDKFKFAKRCNLSTVFVGQTNLVECEFEGVIGGSSQNLSYCPFDAKSTRSAIMCLENYADTSEDLTYQFRLSPIAWNNVNADTENPPPSGNSWQEYVNILGWLTA